MKNSWWVSFFIFATFATTTYLSLTRIQPFELRSLLDPSDPVRQSYEKYLEEFDDRLAITGFVSFPQKITDTSLFYDASTFLEKKLYFVPGLAKITTLTNQEAFSFDSQGIRFQSFFSQRILSEQGRTTLTRPPFSKVFLNPAEDTFLIHLQLDKNLSIRQQEDVVKTLLKLGESFQSSYPQAELHWLGYVIARHYYTEELVRNQTIVTPLVILLVAGVFYFMLGSISITLVSLLFIIICYALNMSFILWIEDGISPYTSFALLFVFIIATADIIHFLTKLAVAPGETFEEKTSYVRRSIFLPCFLTCLTTIIGFVALVFSQSLPVRMLGWFCAVGTLTCFFATFYLLPILIKILAPRFNLRPPRVFLRIHRFPRVLLRWRWLVIAACFGSSALLVWPSFSLQIDDNYYERFVADHPFSKSVQLFRRKMGYLSSMDILLEQKTPDTWLTPAGQTYLQEVTEKIEKLPGVSFTRSPFSFIEMISAELPSATPDRQDILSNTARLLNNHGTIDEYINEKGNMRIGVYVDTLRGSLLKSLTTDINQILQLRNDGSITGKVAGFSTVRAHLTAGIRRDLMESFSASYFCIFLVFILVFRSLRWAILAMIPNILPLVMLGGLMGLWGLWIDDNLIILLNVVLGIIVDDTVYFISIFKHKMAEGSLSLLEILDTTLEETSPALMGMTFMYLVTVPAFALMKLVVFRQVSVFLCLTLAIGLLMDFFLMPLLLPGIAKNRAKTAKTIPPVV